MAFAPDGRTLATADGPTVGLWDVRDSRRLRDLTATGRVSALVFAPRGHTLAVRCTTGGSTRVELWNRDTGRAIRVITSGGQAGVPVFGGDDLLAVALRGPGASDSVKVFDASNGDLVQSLRTPCAVDSVVFSPEGTFLAAGGPGDCPVSVWDTTSLNPPDPRVLYPQGQGGSLQFSPDGQALIDVGDAVVLWDTSGWRSHDLGGVGAVRTAVFAPAGGTLAVAGEGGVALWDTDTDEAFTAPVTGSTDLAAFSPDGGTLATATTGSGVRLWDVATGHLRTALVDSADVRWMEFAPDGRTLVTKDGNDPIQLWNVALPDPGTAVREICAIVADDPALLHRSLVLPGGPVCPR
ncbi:WD40 repeat domain-containing protein [Streptomyces sp. SL13]|uniref:WD40 repeat domain-containing protein n=1 Tax=Streptantibioticus silvisoli TaxID=2705255 RepID=A0AA90H957_9ACTN|nr:WD40 repeat domain-containing protein [Streptantibioticus silvisoli]MDI5972692.1 WD40 repeat domain-containing protein [Streptantibioticus silvisoli]